MIDFFSSNALYGIDSALVLLIIITAFSISYYSHKVYKMVKKRSYKIFSIAFLLIGLGYIFQVLSNLIIYYKVRVSIHDVLFVITSKIPYSELIKVASHFLYEMFSIIAFLLLFFLATSERRERLFILIYLGIVVAVFSIYFPPAYHLTLFVLLVFLSAFFYKNWIKVRSSNSFIVFSAFTILLISNLILTFSTVNFVFYLVGGFLTLFAYTLLLINQIKIKNESKKIKAGSSKGHIRGS